MVFWVSSQRNHGFFWFSSRNQKKTRFFLVFHQKPSRKTKKTLCFFGFPTEIQKNTRFFWFFSPETQQKNKKNLVFFWFSSKNQKKTIVSLGRNPKNQKKTLGKPKNPKVSGPSQRLWTFGFLVSVVVSHGLSKCFLLLSTGKLILKRT